MSRKAPQNRSQEVAATDQPGKSRGMARTLLTPSVTHAATLQMVLTRGIGKTKLADLADELAGQCRAVADGNMGRPEALLVAQAHTLDAMFNDLALLAYQRLDDFSAAERLLRLAFKAQGQSRATIETLGQLKNPRPTILAQQANVTSGPQQVNNSPPTSRHAQARETESTPNELLEQSHGERLDTGTAGGAIGGDSPMEAVGTIQRPPID